MSLFRKIFGSSISTSEEEKEKDNNGASSETDMSIDEQFIYKFKKNGGKFLYCENLAEVKEQFENILEENDWFEGEAVCYDPKLFSLLDENKIAYKNPTSPKFLFSSCENLIADEGSILFSSNQIKQNKHFSA